MASRLQDSDDISETHEINVTPFIDVMLVLLIIFMVAAPLSTVDIPVELPVSQAAPAAKPDKPLYVTLKADLSLAVGNDMVLWGGLGPALDAQTSSDRNKRLFLRADKTVPYGELMRLMDTLRAAGYLKVALVGLEGPPAQGASAHFSLISVRGTWFWSVAMNPTSPRNLPDSSRSRTCAVRRSAPPGSFPTTLGDPLPAYRLQNVVAAPTSATIHPAPILPSASPRSNRFHHRSAWSRVVTCDDLGPAIVYIPNGSPF